jgi:hypothetical protein
MPADESGGHIADTHCISGPSFLLLAVPSANKTHARIPLPPMLWKKRGDHTPPDEFPGASPDLPQIQHISAILR